MIQLRTLGSIDLVGPDSARLEALLRRPKRLALLAYLAIERQSGRQRRDTLLGLFWPENDNVRARAALRQALHVIRGAIGDNAIEAVGDDELSLSPHAVCCDAVAFVRAAAEGRLDQALLLYKGDLLPGLFIDGTPEFDQWLENARQNLRTRALGVAVSIADGALRAGDFEAATIAARRAVEIGPNDESAARRLILALDRSGDRAGALAAYDDLAHRMSEQFNATPSAESRALAVTVRSREHADLRIPGIRTGGAQRVALPPIHRATHPRRRTALLAVCAVLTVSQTGGIPQVRDSHTAITGARAIPQSARDAYQRGLRFLDKSDEVSLTNAVRYFEQARDSEPLYADALAGLGDAYLQLGYWNYLSPDASFPKAITAARRAIELDPRRPDAYATLGFARLYYNRDWAGSERAFRRAIELDSTYAPAHERYAYLLTVLGRSREARAEIGQATQLAPLSLAAATDAGFVYFYNGWFREARTQLESVLLRNPGSPGAHFWLGRLDQGEGETSAALTEYESSGNLRQWVPTIAGVGYLHGVRGERRQARLVLATLDSLARTRYVSPYAVALVYASLGERDAAFAALNHAIDERTNWVVWLARDRRWDPLRLDPRFAKLLERVAFPASSAGATAAKTQRVLEPMR